MDSEVKSTLVGVVKCCDCGCACSFMNQSSPGTWLRSVKRKYDEFEESVRPVSPGSIATFHVARVGVENECAALREMVSNQQQIIQNLSRELDEERNAASSAANETMSMILRLQREKAEIQMEARQFKRFSEEKMAHDQQELLLLEDLLYKREQAIESLICELQAYKHRLTEAEAEDLKGCLSLYNSNFDNDFQSEFPVYDYPPLKCYSNEPNNPARNDEVADVEKHAFGETPRSHVHLKDLEYRINQLEETPNNQADGEFYGTKNVIEKVIVGQSLEMPGQSGKASADSSSSFFATVKEMSSDESSDLKKVDVASEVSDGMNDRVYTIDSVHHVDLPSKDVPVTQAKTSTGDSPSHRDISDPDIKKLYMKLQVLEADRDSMRQALISMRTDKAQLILLKEIAQQLCKEIPPATRMPVRKQSPAGSFSIWSIFKWIMSFGFLGKKARQCKYPCGQPINNLGLLMLLDRGPRITHWRCLSRTQM